LSSSANTILVCISQELNYVHGAPLWFRVKCSHNQCVSLERKTKFKCTRILNINGNHLTVRLNCKTFCYVLARFYGSLSYAISPPLTLGTAGGCIHFEYVMSQYDPKLLRVSTVKDNAYTPIFADTIIDYYQILRLVQIDIAAGNYDGIVFEVQNTDITHYPTGYFAIDYISIEEGPCERGKYNFKFVEALIFRMIQVSARCTIYVITLN